MKNKVSVVIPAYNEEKDIEICLDSLKGQTFKDFEIVVVDDGSTDKTREIVEKYGVMLLKQEHQGPGNARNFGAESAKGEILIFVDADMHFDKDYIKNLIHPIQKKETIIGTTHDYEIATNTNNKWSFLWGKIRVDKTNAKDVKIFRAIRRKKFLDMGGFDQKYGYADDQTFWYKYKIKPVVAKNTTCYHKNPDTLNGTYNQAIWIGASWKERFKIFKIPLFNLAGVLLLWLSLPLFVLLKSFGGTKKISFKDKSRFYWYKFYGYFKGIKKAVLFREVWK